MIWDGSLVTVETYSAELELREEADIARYQEVWKRLTRAARPSSAG